MGIDNRLRHVGQHRIGPAEGHDRQLAEEEREVGQEGLSGGPDQQQRRGPERAPDQRGADGVAPIDGCLRHKPGVFMRAQQAPKAGGQDDGRKGQAEREDGKEGEQGEGPALGSVQCLFRHFPERLKHDHDDQRLDPEKRVLNDGQGAPAGIGEGQRRDDQCPRQHEEQPGQQTARDPTQAPSGIGGQLHRLGPGQQHAEAERAKEILLLEVTALVDQFLVHHGDLSGGAAEGQQADTAKAADHLGPGLGHVRSCCRGAVAGR